MVSTWSFSKRKPRINSTRLKEFLIGAGKGGLLTGASDFAIGGKIIAISSGATVVASFNPPKLDPPVENNNKRRNQTSTTKT